MISVQIHYKDLKYEVQIPLESHEIPNVASEVGNCATGCFRGITRQSAPSKPLGVLNTVDGAIRPGTMTLVLAPPGHGKSALLQTIAGVIDHNQVEGSVSYGSSLVACDPTLKTACAGYVLRF